MAITDALFAVQRQWADVEPRLSDTQLNNVVQFVAGEQGWTGIRLDYVDDYVFHSRSLRNDVAVQQIEELVFNTLARSLDDGDQAWSALLESPTRLSVGDRDRGRDVVMSLGQLAATELLRRDVRGQAHADGVEETVRRDVLRLGYLDIDLDNYDRLDPGYPVIVIDLNGRRAAPSFQFQIDVDTRRIVAYVNNALEVGEDPLGAASWWLSQNAWLGAPPAALLNTNREEEIRLAVDQLSSDSW